MKHRLSLQAVQYPSCRCLARDWVGLVALPETSASTQALLLLPCSDQEWLAWIPDYGEITLHVSQFYEPQSWN